MPRINSPMVGLALVALAGTLVVWRPWAVPPDLPEPADTELTPAQQAAAAAAQILSPRLPRAPTALRSALMVLPVENASADPAERYFAEGLTEELIGSLARGAALAVIGRHTALDHRDGPLAMQALSQALGVRFMLQADLRRENGRLVLNARLIDAVSEQPIWSERYDRPIGDILAVQAELTHRVTVTVAPTAQTRSPAPSGSIGPDTLEALDLLFRAGASERIGSFDQVGEARQLLQRAIALDPAFMPAYPRLHRVMNRFLTEVQSPEFNSPATAQRLLELAAKAVSLDPMHPLARALYAESLTLVGQHGTAMAQIDAVVSSTTTDIDLLRSAAIIAARSGDFERAANLLKRGIKLDPASGLAYWAEPLAGVLYQQGNYAEAIAVATQCVHRHPDDPYCRLGLAAALAQAGQLNAAQRATADARAKFPSLTLKSAALRAGIGHRDPEYARHYAEGLRKAGMPD